MLTFKTNKVRKTLIPVLINALLCILSPLLWSLLFNTVENPLVDDGTLGAGCIFGAIIAEIILFIALVYNAKKDPELDDFFW